MSQKFPLLFTPGRIGRLEIPNRIVKAPTSTGMSNRDGTVSERLIRHYREQAAGGVGLLVCEYAYIDEDASKSAHCQLGISTDDHISGLAWLAEVIREQGARPAIQLEHCGRQKFLGTPPIKSGSSSTSITSGGTRTFTIRLRERAVAFSASMCPTGPFLRRICLWDGE